MKVVDACRELGMPRSSFYYITENDPQAIADIQVIINANNREQLVLILQHRMEIFKKIIQDGLSDKTSPRARLTIFIKMTQLTDELMDTLQLFARPGRFPRVILAWNTNPTHVRHAECSIGWLCLLDLP